MRISSLTCPPFAVVANGIIIALGCVCAVSEAFAGTYLLTEPGTGERSLNAYIESVPGGVFHDEVDVLAKVVAINKAEHEVTLITDAGTPFSLVVDPAAINLDQLKAGDLVKAKAVQTLVVFTGDAGDEAEDGMAAAAIGTPEGEMPGLMGAERIQMTGTLIGIDQASRTVRVEFPDGSVKTHNVRDDVNLEEHAVGMKIVFRLDARVSIEVLPASE